MKSHFLNDIVYVNLRLNGNFLTYDSSFLLNRNDSSHLSSHFAVIFIQPIHIQFEIHFIWHFSCILFSFFVSSLFRVWEKEWETKVGIISTCAKKIQFWIQKHFACRFRTTKRTNVKKTNANRISHKWHIAKCTGIRESLFWFYTRTVNFTHFGINFWIVPILCAYKNICILSHMTSTVQY